MAADSTTLPNNSKPTALNRKPVSLLLEARTYDRLRLLAAAKRVPMTELITQTLEARLKVDRY